MKKLSVFLVVALLMTSLVNIQIVSAESNYDYSTALKYSLYFFDANKCGPEAGVNNYYDWRSACHVEDGSEEGLDLTGGYHDAGDHVKFLLPQAYAASTLAWSLYEYKDVYESTGNKGQMISTLKYFTDFLLKCYAKPGNFYYQVGDGQDDHTYWGAPEEQPGTRPVPYVANASNPGSDVLGMTSASLTLMYLNYKSIDASYANKCLEVAKELYEMGKSNPGKYKEAAFYQSHSYWDDLAWAAAWLYVVEKDAKYLSEIDSYLSNKTYLGQSPFENKWTMCWDDMYMAVFCKMAALTGEQKYKDAMDYNLNHWKTTLTTTPGGLKHLDTWGSLRYVSAECMIALLYYEQTKDESLKSFAKSQIDYALGNNPNNMSYLIGFGSKYPLHPHHRGANGYTYANGDNAKPAKHLLTGALVGGPDATDAYRDDVNQFQYTEVAIDYNASFVGGIAGIVRYYGNMPQVPSPTPTEIGPTPTKDALKWCDVGDLNVDGSINAGDYTLLRRFLLGVTKKLPYQEVPEILIPAGDVDGNGKINAGDYTIMRRYILNIIDEFPVEYDIEGNIIRNN